MYKIHTRGWALEDCPGRRSLMELTCDATEDVTSDEDSLDEDDMRELTRLVDASRPPDSVEDVSRPSVQLEGFLPSQLFRRAKSRRRSQQQPLT